MNMFVKEDVDDSDGEGDDESTASGSSGGPDFNYILNNPLWCLTKEKKDALLKQRDEKVSESGGLIIWLVFFLTKLYLVK